MGSEQPWREAITRLAPAVTQGSISLEGEEVTNAHPRKLIDKGVAYVPEDRMLVGPGRHHEYERKCHPAGLHQSGDF